MKSVLMPSSITAAFARCQHYSPSACTLPDLALEIFDEVTEAAHNLADKIKAQHPEGARVGSIEGHIPAPLVGVVDESGPQRKVLLLSGRLACLAAAKLQASIPVYPLETKGVEALTEAGLLTDKGLTDKAKAIETLLANGCHLAAELLSDTADPLF